MVDLAISNALIINEGKQQIGTVYIDNKTITRIEYGATTAKVEARRVIDGTGKWIIPGVIDDHVHFREPGLCHKGDIESESQAAVAGGVTSFMEMPNTVPQTTRLELLEQKFALAAEHSVANYSFYIGATANNVDQIAKVPVHRVCGVKLFMGSSTGNMLVDDGNALEQIFKAAPTLIAAHCEDEALIRRNAEQCRAQYGETPPFSVHATIRDAEVCYRSSAKAVELAKQHGARLHLMHISTARELSLLNNTQNSANKMITGEACIAHLWLNDTQYAQLGWRMKCNPSVKSEADRMALINGLNNNTIDLIGTDHAPHLRKEKDRNYFESASGIPTIQHSLVAMLELSKRGMFGPELVVQKMCHAPADIFRIDRRGYIREGYYADLALIDPKRPQTVDCESLRYKCKWSVLEGETFGASVDTTVVNGRVVYENGKIDSTVKGSALAFNAR